MVNVPLHNPALLGNPKLRAFSFEVRAAEARTLQAGVFPNPEIQLEAEEFGGSGSRSGFDSAVFTLQFGQLIELGSKRAKRRRVATFEGELAGWDYESARLDLLAETTAAFIDLLAAQRRSKLSLNTLGLAEEFHMVVNERVQAGKVSPLEEIRARVALSLSKIRAERARRDLYAFRSKLSAMWGSESANFTELLQKLPQEKEKDEKHIEARIRHRSPHLWLESYSLKYLAEWQQVPPLLEEASPSHGEHQGL